MERGLTYTPWRKTVSSITISLSSLPIIYALSPGALSPGLLSPALQSEILPPFSQHTTPRMIKKKKGEIQNLVPSEPGEQGE